MRKYNPTTILQLMAILSIAFTSCDNDDTMSNPIDKPDIEFFGLSGENTLIRYNANSETAIEVIVISGLTSGETLLAIDFRPATGQLYGVSSGSRLYMINQISGVATALGSGPFTPAINGSQVALDFNPTVDRIRLVTSSGQNLRLNPETGMVAATDAAINPGSPVIGAVAYNNSTAGASMTTLFDIELTSMKLNKQEPPNDGLLVEVGDLNFTFAATHSGFDISPDNAAALLSLSDGTKSLLYQVDLATGAATELGKLSSQIIGLAIPSNPVAYGVDASNNLQIFNPKMAGTPISKSISGLAVGENILGLDMRPATGQLYALASTSRIYTVNMSTGAATPIGDAPFATLLNGSSFGFDFNPTVDRIRIVSNTGQNLRIHPVTGAVAFVDALLTPGSPEISGAAYANSIPNAMTTTLFDVDVMTDKLYVQNPPNDGVLTEVGILGINVESTNGFDIGGSSGTAYGVFTVGGATKIYTVNIMTGAATAISDYPNALNAFTVGLGF